VSELYYNVYADGIKRMNEDGSYNLDEDEATELASRLALQGYATTVEPLG
jgi:hypothetical protein